MVSLEVMSSEGAIPLTITCSQRCLFLLPGAERRNYVCGPSQPVLQSWSTHTTRQGKTEAQSYDFFGRCSCNLAETNWGEQLGSE